MKGSQLASWILGIIGAILLIGTGIFAEYSWWPQALKNPQTFLSGSVAGMFILAALAFAHLTYGHLQSLTPVIVTANEKLIMNPYDGTYEAGAFYVRRYGGINAAGMSLPGTAGTLVFPKDSVRHVGLNDIIAGVSKRVPFRQLPLEAQEVIINEQLPGPYRAVLGSHYIETRGADYTRQVREWMLRNAGESHAEAARTRTIVSMQQVNRMQHRQIERMARPKGVSGILAKLGGNNETEDKPSHDEDRER